MSGSRAATTQTPASTVSDQRARRLEAVGGEIDTLRKLFRQPFIKDQIPIREVRAMLDRLAELAGEYQRAGRDRRSARE